MNSTATFSTIQFYLNAQEISVKQWNLNLPFLKKPQSTNNKCPKMTAVGRALYVPETQKTEYENFTLCT